jgi:DNA-binding IclR family transcriptional regulator
MMPRMTGERAAGGNQKGIQSIAVGARVLVALQHGHGPLGLTEVARGAELHPAKARRYLTSLMREGLATQDPTTGMYDLGPTTRELGVEALRRADPVRVASAFALGLRDETRHTINISIWSEVGPVMVGWDTGTYEFPMVFRLGSTLAILDSAVGLVFLGHLPTSVSKPVIAAQQKRGATRKASASEISALRESSREAPYTNTRDGLVFGLSALAAPIFAASGTIELVLGMIIPTEMMTRREEKRLGNRLRLAADRASRELGAPIDSR